MRSSAALCWALGSAVLTLVNFARSGLSFGFAASVAAYHRVNVSDDPTAERLAAILNGSQERTLPTSRLLHILVGRRGRIRGSVKDPARKIPLQEPTFPDGSHIYTSLAETFSKQGKMPARAVEQVASRKNCTLQTASSPKI